jgi:hypothetical protein
MEEFEKDHGLTRRTRACSERLDEVRSGRISPVTGGEEEDTPVAVIVPGSIASVESYRVTRRSSMLHRFVTWLCRTPGRREVLMAVVLGFLCRERREKKTRGKEGGGGVRREREKIG